MSCDIVQIESKVPSRTPGDSGNGTHKGGSLPRRRSMNWFALHIKPQYEKAVAEQLKVRSLDEYLPLYRSRIIGQIFPNR
jgi:hypothetical protein